MNEEVVATSPAWLRHFTCPPAGKELFRSGAVKGKRSNTSTKTEERGWRVRCCAAPSCTTAIPCPLHRSARQQPVTGSSARAWCYFCFPSGVRISGGADLLLEGTQRLEVLLCAVVLISRGGMLLANAAAAGNTGQGGISLRKKCAGLRLSLHPSSALCFSQSNDLFSPVPCTLQLLYLLL